MTRDWIAQTWDRVVITAPTMPLRHSSCAGEFRRAVDVWTATCEIVISQCKLPQGGEQWDNRRVHHVR